MIKEDYYIKDLIIENLKFKTHIGIFLGGSKSDKTVVCNLRYFPQYKKLVVQDVFESLGPAENQGADLQLISLMHSFDNIENIGVNASLQLPACIQCKLICPGAEDCKVEEVSWMNEFYERHRKTNKKMKMASPYIDRAVEYYINQTFDKPFEIQYSLSANAAPLTARAFFLQRHISAKWIEILPNLSLWRLGSYLKISASQLKNYRKDENCEEIRFRILEKMKEVFPLFVYHQDKQRIVSNPNAFDAFLCAFTAYMDSQQQTEQRPKNFPAKAKWIAIPKENLEKMLKG